MSEKIRIVGCDGEPLGDFAVDKGCIEAEKGTQAVHSVVVAYLAGLRAGTACTKTRSEVRGGKRKPYRQKGTGRARSGAANSPIWTGGGVVFGPRPRSFAKQVNKKVRKLAIRKAFSEKLMEGAVIILDKFELVDNKTRNAAALIAKLNLTGTVTVVVDEFSENAVRATANIKELSLVKACSLNVYQILHTRNLVFTRKSVELFIERIK
ncbi:MAG: 50S ribosomal protein L4 [Victivallales bacterium]|nr:50S ribosomal protein L4 [Victivallales bacterium]